MRAKRGANTRPTAIIEFVSPGPMRGDDGDRQDDRRERHERLDEPHDDPVGPAAEVARPGGRGGTRSSTPTPTASTEASSEVGAPYISRLSTSRPRLSVPSRWPWEPGGRRMARRSWAFGSSGASTGAKIATSTMRRSTVNAATAVRCSRNRRDERAARPAGDAVSAASVGLVERELVLEVDRRHATLTFGLRYICTRSMARLTRMAISGGHQGDTLDHRDVA